MLGFHSGGKIGYQSSGSSSSSTTVLLFESLSDFDIFEGFVCSLPTEKRDRRNLGCDMSSRKMNVLVYSGI